MAQVYISVGSNQDCERNIVHALRRLREAFGLIRCSPVYRSAAVGGGADYHNLAVGFTASVSLRELRGVMQSIEAELGRDREKRHCVSIDLDILLYDDMVGNFANYQLPHPDIFRYRYVLKPLADIAGDVIPPGGSVTIRTLLRDASLVDDELELVGEY